MCVCVCVCVLTTIIHIIWELHAEARGEMGGDNLQQKTEKVCEVLTPFLFENRLQSLFLKTTA